MNDAAIKATDEYDARFFSGGLRRKIHIARFFWLERVTRGMSGAVIEVGCNNGRALEHLAFRPTRYLGLDPIENAVVAAKAKYPDYDFKVSRSPEDVEGQFELALALETLEHIKREDVPEYLRRLSLAAPKLVASVPVEIGFTFAVKHLAKFALYGDRPVYSVGQFINQTLGRSHLVPQHEHLGFDYRWLLREIEKHYVIESVDGLPFGIPPFTANVAVTARSKAF